MQPHLPGCAGGTSTLAEAAHAELAHPDRLAAYLRGAVEQSRDIDVFRDAHRDPIPARVRCAAHVHHEPGRTGATGRMRMLLLSAVTRWNLTPAASSRLFLPQPRY